jgi:hypothetical protein
MKKGKVRFIPGNVPSSKNSRIYNHDLKRSFPSKIVSRYYRASSKHYKALRDEFHLEMLGFKKPVFIKLHFVRSSKRRYDWVNPVQTVQDRMVNFNWIDDDDVENIYPAPLKIGGKYTSVSKDEAGVFIQICELI